MVDTVKISALPAVPSAQSTDIFPVVQSGATKRETVDQLRTFLQTAFTALTGVVNYTGATPSASLRSNTNASDTLLFQAYDTNAGSYTTFSTLTSANPPTMDLSSSVTRNGGNPILSALVDDPSPQLGNNLNGDGYDINDIVNYVGATPTGYLRTNINENDTLEIQSYNTFDEEYNTHITFTAGDPGTCQMTDILLWDGQTVNASMANVAFLKSEVAFQGQSSASLSANVVLQNNSNNVQLLDPNGANRDVMLPIPDPVTVYSPFFTIKNTGSANTLTVKNNAGVPVGLILSPGMSQTYLWNGTLWTVIYEAINQNVNTSGSPSWSTASLSGLTASTMISLNASKEIESIITANSSVLVTNGSGVFSWSNNTRKQVAHYKFAGDTLASETTPESPVFMIGSITGTLLNIWIQPGDALTADNTNYATITVSRYDSNGANKVTVMTVSTTDPTGTGDWVAFSPLNLDLIIGISNTSISAGDNYSLEITKNMAGVSVPAFNLVFEYLPDA